MLACGYTLSELLATMGGLLFVWVMLGVVIGYGFGAVMHKPND